MYISRKKFVTYLEVQCDETTDMRDIDKIVERSNIISWNGLKRDEVIYIQNHYAKLFEKYKMFGVNLDIRSIR